MSEQVFVFQMVLNKDLCDIILKLVVFEKSYGFIDEGKYIFFVDFCVLKIEIKFVIEKIFGVKVVFVNMFNCVGKVCCICFGIGKCKDIKCVIVILKLGIIDIFMVIG